MRIKQDTQNMYQVRFPTEQLWQKYVSECRRVGYALPSREFIGSKPEIRSALHALGNAFPVALEEEIEQARPVGKIELFFGGVPAEGESFVRVDLQHPEIDLSFTVSAGGCNYLTEEQKALNYNPRNRARGDLFELI